MNENLRHIGSEASESKRATRRALSALTNTARIVATNINPDTGLRLPEVIDTLADLLPHPQPLQRLRTNYQFRQSGT